MADRAAGKPSPLEVAGSAPTACVPILAGTASSRHSAQSLDPGYARDRGAGDLTQRAALDDDGCDDETGLRHPADPAPAGGDRGRGGRRRAGVRLFLCLETPHSYVLVEHTSRGTINSKSHTACFGWPNHARGPSHVA